MARTNEVRDLPKWVTPILYAISVSLSAGLFSFLILLLIVLFTDDGERAMGLGIEWIFLLPWILMAGFLGRISFRWYLNQRTHVDRVAVFLSTVIVVMIIGVAVGNGFFWLIS